MILSIRDLAVRYRVDKYIVAYLRDQINVAELKRYLTLSQGGHIEISTSDKRFLDRVSKQVREEVEKFRKKGTIHIYALNGVNLDVADGTVMAIVGESGCGKSTLALSILRVLPANSEISGEIIFDGENLLALDEEAMRARRAKKLGYIGQGSYTYLNPLMDNAFQILESALVAADDPDKAVNFFMNAIKAAKLDMRALFTFPSRLSGGEIRRVAFALALAKNPRLLVCDEPFRNLDIYLAKQLAHFLRELRDKLKTTMLIFTHNLALMAEIADEIAVMYHGMIVEKGPTEKIFLEPVHPYTKGLIGALPDPRNPGKKLIYIPGEPLPRMIKYDFCPFYNRCPIAEEECLRKIPNQREIDGRFVACTKAEELIEVSPIEFWEPYLEL